ncbi:MAG: 50S ribosomal protein L15, partial [Deltaproteobacteria bacterium]|nr:50S ribosomal protein L15 [Deltaproteobacteria bacterium]
MKLNELAPPKGAKKARKRVGRGPGSGRGKTAGRGHKGLKARSGGSVRPGFEGGQMPLHRRLPKGGFKNIFRVHYAEVNVRDLARFEAGATVDAAALAEAGIIKNARQKVKLLGQGEVSAALTVRVAKASE